MYQLYDNNRDRPGTGTKHVKTASFFIKTGFSFVKNGLQSRLRPGCKSHGDPGVREVQTRVCSRPFRGCVDIYPPCRDELIRRGWALVHDPSLTGAYLVTNQRPLSKRQRDFLYGYFKDMGMTSRAELYQKEDGSGMLPARGIEE